MSVSAPATVPTPPATAGVAGADRPHTGASPDPKMTPSPPGAGAELRIIEWHNEWIVRSAYPFAYQAPDPTLRELRERYRLDEVVAPGRSEFEQVLRLREWVHTRWRHGWTRTPPAHNALDILRAAEEGGDFSCGYYAITLMQCLLALGFVARPVSISKGATEWLAADEGNVGHSVVEFWSHQHHKWVVLDPDLNVHYEHDGTPLSALEVHRAWVMRHADQVRLVPGPTPFRLTEQPSSGAGITFQNPDNEAAEFWIFGRHHAMDYYTHLRLPLTNTQHSAPPASGSVSSVHWIDAWTPPNVIDYNRPNAAAWTANEHDLSWTVNQVQIELRAVPERWEEDEAVLAVTLGHSMPNLAALLVRLDEEPWRETPPTFTWRLEPGKNQIMAKGVNAFGREGHVSRVLLRYHPPYPGSPRRA
jgi:hypothetical protein